MFKSFIQSFRSKLITNKYFKRSLAIYLSIVLIFSCATILLLTLYIRNTLIDSFSDSQEVFISQISSNIDSFVVKPLDIVISKNFSFENKLDENIMYFFGLKDSENANALKIYETASTINNIWIDNSFLDSIILFNTDANIALSSHSGVFYFDNDQERQDVFEFDYPVVKKFFRSNQKNTLWIKSTKANGENIAAYLYKSKTNSESVPVCVIFLLNTDNLINQFNSNKINSNINILTKDDIIIASNNYSDNLLENISSTDFYNYNQGNLIKSGNVINYKHSQYNDWIYIGSTQISSISNVSKTMSRSIVITILIMFFCIILAYYVTVKLQEPINKLFLAASNISQNGDKISDFEHLTDFLSYDLTAIEQTMEENKSIIISHCAYDILNGCLTDISEVIDKLKSINVPFDYDEFLIVIFNFSDKIQEAMSSKERYFLLYKLSEKISDYYGNTTFCSSITHKNSVVTFFALNSDKKFLINKESLANLRLGNTCNIYIGKTTGSIEQISNDFNNIETYLKYKFVYGFGNIIYCEEIDKLEASCNEIPIIFMEDIETSVTSCAFDKTITSIDALTNALINGNYSYNYIQSVLLSTINIICKTVKDLKFDISYKRIIEEFQQISDIKDYSAWTKNILSLCKTEYEIKCRSISNEFINKILVYIKENIHCDLSLTSVAETFNISPNYLSKIFKDSLNINFSTYLSDAKFDEAANLLIREKNKNVTEIAEMVGYFNMPYFNQQFKKRFGYTPLQYRKKNIKSE